MSANQITLSATEAVRCLRLGVTAAANNQVIDWNELTLAADSLEAAIAVDVGEITASAAPVELIRVGEREPENTGRPQLQGA